MNKKAFTLVELMVVIAIIVIISMIGYGGITIVRSNIQQNLWQSQVDVIENGAVLFGEDNKNRLADTCIIDNENKTSCLTVTVQYLLDTNYIPSEEFSDGKKVIINETKDEDDPLYYANNMEVNIYLENNIVYAKLIQ